MKKIAFLIMVSAVNFASAQIDTKLQSSTNASLPLKTTLTIDVGAKAATASSSNNRGGVESNGSTTANVHASDKAKETLAQVALSLDKISADIKTKYSSVTDVRSDGSQVEVAFNESVKLFGLFPLVTTNRALVSFDENGSKVVEIKKSLASYFSLGAKDTDEIQADILAKLEGVAVPVKINLSLTAFIANAVAGSLFAEAK